ncbi:MULTISPECIES: LytR/AlgR family response regulator transcription factor [Rhodonellum]|nr:MULTISPECIES: response regulator [Rhodonellum]SDZ40183.1 two component transcriptional regulator, LytTR family [Rhodonellum ikkaensis]
MKKIFIVEDELDLAENIRDILKFSGHEIVGNEEEGEKAYKLIMESKPDLILMDVMLKGEIDGIQLAKSVSEKLEVPIIFITAHSDQKYLERISGLKYDSFLLKPFTKEVLITTVNLTFLKYLNKKVTKNILNIRDKGFLVPIDEDNIIMLKADGLYTRIYTIERQYVIRDILKDVIGKLSEKKFIRIHKSYLINLDHVTGFNAKEVTIASFTAPIRRGFFKELGVLLVERLNN